jgi:hypothetical protein
MMMMQIRVGGIGNPYDDESVKYQPQHFMLFIDFMHFTVDRSRRSSRAWQGGNELLSGEGIRRERGR